MVLQILETERPTYNAPNRRPLQWESRHRDEDTVGQLCPAALARHMYTNVKVTTQRSHNASIITPRNSKPFNHFCDIQCDVVSIHYSPVFNERHSTYRIYIYTNLCISIVSKVSNIESEELYFLYYNYIIVERSRYFWFIVLFSRDNYQLG